MRARPALELGARMLRSDVVRVVTVGPAGGAPLRGVGSLLAPRASPRAALVARATPSAVARAGGVGARAGRRGDAPGSPLGGWRPACSAASDGIGVEAASPGPAEPAVLRTLRSRGLVSDVTSVEAVAEAAARSPPSPVYLGVDPTADSLHLGNLLCLVTLSWFARHGHPPVLVLGGATGAVGDPSGKDAERPSLDAGVIARNAASIACQATALLDPARSAEVDQVQAEVVEELLGQGGGASEPDGPDGASAASVPTAPPPAPRLVDNADWWAGVTLLEFLRTAGKKARVGPMLAREAVRSRLGATGLSFTEFTYQLLQAHDFVHLHSTLGVAGQIGGSDQWGNITAGTDAIRRMALPGHEGDADEPDGREEGGGDAGAPPAEAREGGEARAAGAPASGDGPPSEVTPFGLTIPLLTRADGTKFGKSESGAIWLSPDKMSPYALYQNLFATPDADVDRLLRALTFLPLPAIDRATSGRLPPNTSQRLLAECVVAHVHGRAGLEAARRATAALAPGSDAAPDARLLRDLAVGPRAPPLVRLPRASAVGTPVVDLFVVAGLAPSKAAARRLVAQGGARLNNVRVSDPAALLSPEDILGGDILMLSAGKKSRALVRVE